MYEWEPEINDENEKWVNYDDATGADLGESFRVRIQEKLLFFEQTCIFMLCD